MYVRWWWIQDGWSIYEMNDASSTSLRGHALELQAPSDGQTVTILVKFSKQNRPVCFVASKSKSECVEKWKSLPEHGTKKRGRDGQASDRSRVWVATSRKNFNSINYQPTTDIEPLPIHSFTHSPIHAHANAHCSNIVFLPNIVIQSSVNQPAELDWTNCGWNKRGCFPWGLFPIIFE